MADADVCESGNVYPPSLTAGIIIIGDEILKGHTKDVNSHFLVKRFWSLGIKVCKISVVADDESDISHEVQSFSKSYTFVITTGGIGPTHDDVTVLSIAKSFNEKIVKNERVVELIAQAYGVEKSNLNESQMKMAMLPSSAELVHNNDMKKNPFPVIRVHNVYIFPGVPHFMEKDFLGIEHIFDQRGNNEFHLCKVFLSEDETKIAHVLDEVNEKYKKTVQLGSYPEFCSREYQVKLTLESNCKQEVKKACRYLLGKLPVASIIRVEGLEMENGDEAKPQDIPCIKDILSLLKSSNNSNTSGCVKGAWAVIQEVLRDYSLEELCLSFNGGKDCTVLLHLFHAAVSEKCNPDTKINALYIRYDSPFPEAEEFIQETTKRYNLNLITVQGNIKSALQGLKTTHPKIKAILLGTRRHDPFTERLRTFTCTDPGWPEYMRVNPILDWHHCDVWSVILHFSIPYCSLYDKGYTSLGSTHNTLPNPALRVEGDEEKYKPAYLLEDDHQERAGRT